LETVAAALRLFETKFEKRKTKGGWSEWEPLGNIPQKVHSCDECKSYGIQQRWIHDFLNWPPDRIKNALAQLHAIEEGELSKKAVETLPTIHATDYSVGSDVGTLVPVARISIMTPTTNRITITASTHAAIHAPWIRYRSPRKRQTSIIL
jgi:hypothetical protein